jgi:hypothetical protein
MTDTVIDWIDIFTRPACKHIILESLQYCQEQKMMILLRITNAYIHDCRNEVRRSQLQIRQDERTARSKT